MASTSSTSSSKPHVVLEVRKEYPYPSHVCSPNFITFMLSDRDEYDLWKTQMLCHLESHDMLGFIDGTHVSPQTTFSGKEKVDDIENNQRLWRRSDALVKGWILGALSKQTLRFVFDRVTKKCNQERNTSDFSAKDAWVELINIYDRPADPSPPVQDEGGGEEEDEAKSDDDNNKGLRKSLYAGILAGNWAKVDAILETCTEVQVTDIITNNGNTALHVAVDTTNKREFLDNILNKIPAPVNKQLSTLKNSDGSTLLHVAATVGNTKAAEILLEKCPEMLLVKDNENQTPLAIALSSMHAETSQRLLQHIKNDDTRKAALFSGTSGDGLLATVISSKDFRFANEMAMFYSSLHSNAVLMALAKNFPGELTTCQKYIDIYVEKTNTFRKKVEDHLTSAMNNTNNSTCFQSDGTSWVERVFACVFRAIFGFIRFLMWIPKKLVWPSTMEKIRIHNDAEVLLRKVCELIRTSCDQTSQVQYFSNSIIEATRNDAYEVVHYIMKIFPDAISIANEDGHSVIQYAVISRSEKVYNLFYDMSQHRNVYRTTTDAYGNNLLHLAARLAPIDKLNLIPGAALQIQRELQWYKEVEAFVCPLSRTQTNSFNETPKMIFTREHKDLLVEGEKWMKATAKSFTIAAALITTIVFAAAITVPGGNWQDTGGSNQHKEGLPIFTNNTAFSVFAISDAISLFASVTSLLTLLSVLTTRYAEEDFLSKLPLKLIIGSTSLFISTTSMVIAFGATLYLVFGQSKITVLIITFVLTCLQITVFVILQFRLVYDLVCATYGRSIFGRIRDQPIY